MTALPPKGKGYKIDPDKMRQALKLAQDMYDELDERAHEVPDLVGIIAPASDPTSQDYTSGQERGARKSASQATGKYGEAFNAQMQYLGQLIPSLQQALGNYEAQEDATAAHSQARKSEV